MASDVSWVETNLDSGSGTIDDGGVKIHLPTIGDNYGGDVDPNNTFNQPMPSSAQFPAQGNEDFQLNFDGIKDQLTTQIAGSLLNNTSQQASSFLNFYAHIDWIRPHFDVSPGEVARRLLGAFVPGWRKDFGEGNADLYGPSMIVFTLISILVFTMKGHSSKTNDGSLMGVAFGISFTYWFFTSIWYYILAYSLTTDLSFLHVLSITGYGMLGCCVSLLPRLFLLPDVVTLASFAVFGSLSGLSLSYLFFKKANHQKSGMVVGSLVLATHAVFLFYLYSFFVLSPADEAQKTIENRIENLLHQK